MSARISLVAAALLGFFAVALGAFGAHGLKSVLEPAMMQVWQTAVLYHLVHSVALLAVAIWHLQQPSVWLARAALMLLIGTLLFSGSLYLMALTGVRILGMITPLGGVSWLIGWSMLMVAGLKTTSQTGIQSDR